MRLILLVILIVGSTQAVFCKVAEREGSAVIVQLADELGRSAESASSAVSGSDHAEIDTALSKKLANLIDFAEISRRAFGDQYSRFEPGTHKEFEAAIRRLIEKRYYQRWRGVLQGGADRIEVLSSRKDGDDILIDTLVRQDKKKERVVWRLGKSSPGSAFRIVSLSVGSKDLVQSLSRRLQAFSKGKDAATILQWLETRSENR